MKKIFTPAAAKGRALWRCSKCGTLQMSPMPSAAELESYYQSYDVLGERDPYYRAAWSQQIAEGPEKEEAETRLAFIAPYIYAGGRILEVGSGPGLFLRLAAAAGLKAEGVELNAEAARRSAEEFGLKVVPGSIAAADGGMDGIALWDLLEHVSDPAALLKQCAERLRPNGCLFIETPDESSVLDRAVNFLRRLGIKWPAETFYGMHHLVLFRPPALRKLLEANGFAVLKISHRSTDPARVFRGNGFKDKIMRLAIELVEEAGVIAHRENKMLVVARKTF